MKNDTGFFHTLLRVSVFLGMVGSVAASGQQVKKSKIDKMAKTGGVQGYKPERYNLLNINNLTSWHRNDGLSNHSTGGDNGVYYPRGTSWVIYEDGLIWGARAYVDANKTTPAPYNQITRVGGSTYGTNGTTGPVIGSGASAVPSGKDHPGARIYRIRRDWKELEYYELSRDAAESYEIVIDYVRSNHIEAIIDDYRFSWENWPVHLGAPYIDRNGNGVYDPPPSDSSAQSLIDNQYDEPGIAGVDPDSPADQVLWCVWNDLDREQAARFGSEPMGLEVQMTLWGYNRRDPLANVYFKKWKIINKGGVEIDNAGTLGSFYLDSMYVAQWSDPDVGAFGDDLIGVDIERNMGYAYNGNTEDLVYRKHNLPPPAVGYDLLQGPVVSAPGERAVVDMRYREGFKNLGLSSFSYDAAGDPYSEPDDNTSMWDKRLRGYASLLGPDVLYNHPPGVTPGLFPLNGDPVMKTGFIDGLGTDYSFPPGDRRMQINSGPFALAPGDTQEVIIALVAGLGADRLSSILDMRFNDSYAQAAYTSFFRVSRAPASPKVSVQELDQEIILDWGSPVHVDKTENLVVPLGQFEFEGYNIYQLPTATSPPDSAIRIKTFDLINDNGFVVDKFFDRVSGHPVDRVVQFGRNSGIERVFVIDRNYLQDYEFLNNGTEYHFAVTAYSVAIDPSFRPRSLESDMQVITVRPKRPFGVDYKVSLYDTLKTTAHVAGQSDGTVYPLVIDPSALTGDTYRVTFTDEDDDKRTEFHLENVTTGTELITDEANQTGDDDYLHTEGFQARVVGAPLEFKMFTAIANGTGPIVPPVGAAADFRGFPVPSRPGVSQQVGAGKWMIAAGGQRTEYDLFLEGTSNNGELWENIIPYDYEWRFTETGGYALLAFTNFKVVKVPFELWRIGFNTPDDPSDDIRMIPFIFDADGNDQFNLQAIDHPLSGGPDDPYTDWVDWTMPLNDTPGETGYYAWETAVLALPDSIDADRATSNLHTNDNNMRRMVLVNWNGGDVTAVPPVFNQEMPETGTIFRIETTKPNTVDDVFEFTTIAPTATKELALRSAENIGVFPNPFGMDPGAPNVANPYVTFNNLPPEATLRIFNLAGQFVRRLEKNDNSQFMRWDLRNGSGRFVASGVYIVHVLLPELGFNKVLKLVIGI